MNVFAFDVSTTCTGFGICTVDGKSCTYVASGRIRKKGDPMARAEEYADAIMEQIIVRLPKHTCPDRPCDACALPKPIVIVEVPSTREYTAKPGMGTLGFLAGYIMGALVTDWNTSWDIRAFFSDDWRGKGKAKRQKIVKSNFTQYTGKGDKGMDESDALAMILLLHQRGEL